MRLLTRSMMRDNCSGRNPGRVHMKESGPAHRVHGIRDKVHPKLHKRGHICPLLNIPMH